MKAVLDKAHEETEGYQIDASTPDQGGIPEYSDIEELIDDMAPYCTWKTYVVGVDVESLSDDKGRIDEKSRLKGSEAMKEFIEKELEGEEGNEFTENGWRVFFKYDGSIGEIQKYIENDEGLVLEEAVRSEEE